MVLREDVIKIVSQEEVLFKEIVSQIEAMEGGVPIKGDWTIPDHKANKGVGIRDNKVAGIVKGGSRAMRRGRMIRKGVSKRKVCAKKTLLTSNAIVACNWDTNSLSVIMILYAISVNNQVTWVLSVRVGVTRS
jgi:hypothetical protein